MNKVNDQEIRYRLFKILDDTPHLTQRQMAGQMGISLGKFNYCITELVKRGFVKMDRFRSSANKAAYMYILTPKGLEEKTRITTRFLHRKMEEFEEIKKQIEELVGEMNNMVPNARQINKKQNATIRGKI
jgi:MarR family transcriptional regulator, temperature-dependent positive regulator of motility